MDIPCVGINSLESLSYNVINKINENDCVFSIIDCKNDNCYFALFQKKNGIIETLIEPQAESLLGALAILKSYCEDTLGNECITFIGDGSEIYKDNIKEVFEQAKFGNESENKLDSYSLALAGFHKYSSGVELNEVLPLYLKKPQAQMRHEGQA